MKEPIRLAVQPAEPAVRAEGRPRGIPDRLHRLKQLFLATPFREEIARLGYTVKEAAARASVARCQVFGWLNPDPRSYTPRASTLERFLDENGIDRGPYLAYLAEARPTRQVYCPDCGHPRPIRTGRITQVETARGTPLPILPNGWLEYRCEKHARAATGRAALKKVNKYRFEGYDTKTARAEVIDAYVGSERLAGNQAKFKEFVRRKPRRPGHREGIARARVLRGVGLGLDNTGQRPSGRQFNRCHFCGLWVYAREWHEVPPCRDRWRAWCRAHGVDPSSLPPEPWRATTWTVRRKADPAVMIRNFRFLLRRCQQVSRREILADAAGEIKPYTSFKDRSALRPPVRQTVNIGSARFLEHASVSFDVMFPPTTSRAFLPKWRARLEELEGCLRTIALDDPARNRLEEQRRTLEDRIARRRRSGELRDTGRDRAERRRRSNEELANRVPLPLLLHPIIAAGRRDALVARLHFFEWSASEIVELTGVPEERVKAVIAGPVYAEVATELAAWLERHVTPAP